MTSNGNDDHHHLSAPKAVPSTSPPRSLPLRRRLRPPMLNLPRSTGSCGPVTSTSSIQSFFRARPSARVEDETMCGPSWAVHARRGRRRANREDMFAIHLFMPTQSPSHKAPISVFAVFDGHGGSRAAKYARDQLPNHIISAIEDGYGLAEAMESAFLTTDQEFSSITPATSTSHATPPPAPSPPTAASFPDVRTPGISSDTPPTQPLQNHQHPILHARLSSEANITTEKGLKLSRTPSGSSFASVALQRTPEYARSSAVNGMRGYFHDSSNEPRARADCGTDSGSGRASCGDAAAPITQSVCRANSLQLERKGSSSSASMANSALGLELRRCKTRVDEHLSSVAVPTGRSSGTTATVLTITDTQLIIAHVGDTRAVLSSGGGKEVKRLCDDHRPGRSDEAARIESAGGLVTQGRRGTCRVNGVLAVSRSIGDVDFKDTVIARPDVRTVELDGDEDFVLIASDGVWDVVDDEEVAVLLTKTKIKVDASLKNKEKWEEEGVKALVESAWDKGSTDDICALVVDVKKFRLMAEKTNKENNNSGNWTTRHSKGKENNNSGNWTTRHSKIKENNTSGNWTTRHSKIKETVLSVDNGEEEEEEETDCEKSDDFGDLMTPMAMNGPMTQRRRQTKPF